MLRSVPPFPPSAQDRAERVNLVARRGVRHEQPDEGAWAARSRGRRFVTNVSSVPRARFSTVSGWGPRSADTLASEPAAGGSESPFPSGYTGFSRVDIHLLPGRSPTDSLRSENRLPHFDTVMKINLFRAIMPAPRFSASPASGKGGDEPVKGVSVNESISLRGRYIPDTFLKRQIPGGAPPPIYG